MQVLALDLQNVEKVKSRRVVADAHFDDERPAPAGPDQSAGQVRGASDTDRVII